MKEILLVRYKEDDTIEGYVNTKEEFKLWLKNWNKQRKAEGTIIEYESEFELINVKEL